MTIASNPSPRRCRAISRPALALVAVVVAGCGTNPKQLHVEDDSRPIATARAVFRLGGSGTGGPGIEFEASQVRASSDQVLQSTDIVTLGDRSILGPGQLRSSARVSHAQVVYNHLLFAGRPIELEWFAGVAWVRTSWNTESANAADPHLASRSDWYGPAGGALARVHLAPLLSLEARVSATARTAGSTFEGERRFTEFALALRPAPSLVLRGGVAEARSWVRPEAGSSELSVRARGPFFNLGLEF
jgi:hypothetical protein